jgi:hypothetical protein
VKTTLVPSMVSTCNGEVVYFVFVTKF